MIERPEKPYKYLRDRGVMTLRDLRARLNELKEEELDRPFLLPTADWWAYCCALALPIEDENTYVFPTLIVADHPFDTRDA